MQADVCRHAPSGVQGSRMHTAKQEQLALLLWWLFGAVVVPLMRTFFYVTDSQPTRFATLYYRKPAWRQLEGEALRLLTEHMYQV